MEIKANKKERGAVGVYVTNKSAVVDVTADVDYRGESYFDVRGVVYG